jgi:nitronate monooxygenase
MSRTRIFDSLRLPLISAPMFLVSGPDLVIAACRAGIIGSFPTPNCRTLDELDQWMDRIDHAVGSHGAKLPWAVNLIVHRTNTRLDDDLAIVLRYKPPIVITALGSPARIVEAVQAYGGIVLADISTMLHARKAAAVGVDGLVLVSAGAGGHTGTITPFAFVPAVREFFDGLIVLAGGVSGGRGIAAARALGANLVYAGTRFIASAESQAPEDYKSMLVEATVESLVPTAALTGALANMLRPSIERAGLDPDKLGAGLKPDFSDGALFNRPWKHIWSAGHGVGTITAVETVADIVDRWEGEYHAAIADLTGTR